MIVDETDIVMLWEGTAEMDSVAEGEPVGVREDDTVVDEDAVTDPDTVAENVGLWDTEKVTVAVHDADAAMLCVTVLVVVDEAEAE